MKSSFVMTRHEQFHEVSNRMVKTNLGESLKKVQNIIGWFDNQEEVDVEKGLEKIKEGTELIKASRIRLKEIENEFREVEKGLKDDK